MNNSKKLFKTAVEWKYIRKNPFENIKTRKVRKKAWYYICPQEFNQILSKISHNRVRALYGVLYGCGLRLGEAVNLLWDGQNINFENNRINILNREGSRNIPPFQIKDYENRSVPMPSWVVDLLAILHSEIDDSCPFVFLTQARWEKVQEKWEEYRKAGKASDWTNDLMINNVLRDFKRLCRRAGIVTNDKLTIHCLRKSYGTNLANAGTPIQTLKKLMGHSSIETTMEYYLFSSDANEEKAVRELERMMGEVK